MDRPYGISDFAFPTRWDREFGPDVVERAGRGSERAAGQVQPGRETGPAPIRSRSGFDRSRTIYRGRHRDYSLRESEVRTLTDEASSVSCRQTISPASVITGRLARVRDARASVERSVVGGRTDTGVQALGTGRGRRDKNRSIGWLRSTARRARAFPA